MAPTTRSGLTLAAGLGLSLLAALAPAGLRGASVPAWSYGLFAVVGLGAIAALSSTYGGAGAALRRLAYLLPPVLLLTVPASLLAAPGRRVEVALALALRSLAAAAALLATVSRLGPAGTISGLRFLRAPSRLVDVVHAMLVSLAAIARQVSGMLRARAARRPRRGPWSSLAVSPADTVLGFGRLAGAVFLRAMERAEVVERARRARSGDPR